MKLLAPGVLVLVFALSLSQTVSAQAVIVSCPFALGGDHIDRGFYITSYPGSNLYTVHVKYEAFSTSGAYSVSMTARLGAYNGPIIGSAQTVTVSLTTTAFTDVTFNFGGAPVTPGSTVTFTQVQTSGPAADDVFYDIGNGNLGGGGANCPGVTETAGTSPPLDSLRRNTVGVEITQLNVIPEYPLGLPLLAIFMLVGYGFVRRKMTSKRMR
jgi:hypothetical protein